MKIPVSYFGKTFVEAKFLMIYMETGSIHDKDAFAKKNKGKLLRWHLEDELRPTVALCGFSLHGTCKSVSPALAMFGAPCEACMAIVSAYIFDPKLQDTGMRRLQSLIQSDLVFRATVTKSVDPKLFAANFKEEDPFEGLVDVKKLPLVHKRSGSPPTLLHPAKK